jgi:erythromycin esterase-like protein
MSMAVAVALTVIAQPVPAATLVPPSGQSQWIKEHAIPVKTVQAGNGFEDLEPLKALIGNARVVALGEPTHGTREAFQMKHRLVEFLSQQMGFGVFSIEASMPDAFAVDEFASGWRGDPRKLIGGMGFWTWNTEEVLDMVRWMERNNQKGPNTIRFTGFDMQSEKTAATTVLGFLSRADPKYASEVEGVYNELKSARASEGSGFGVATGSFPIEAAAGKHVVFSGWIRTEDVTAYAGLWWRADGKDGSPGAFENMSGRGPKGTTDWTRYSVELDIPADTSNINFGVLMPGKGRAWFDDLSVEIDGKAYSDPDRFDFTFEGGSLKGLAAPDGAANGGYSTTIDRTRAHGGQGSLLVASGPAPDGLSPSEAAKRAGEVLAHMEKMREGYAHDVTEDEADWAIQNARVISQCYRTRAAANGFSVRDQCMAENVKWILDHSPANTRIVLWAHNGHVNRQPGCMGSHLAKLFGKDYVAIGFGAGHGRYTAMGEGGLGGHDLAPPPAGSFEWLAESTGAPLFILPTRDASPNDASSFLTAPMKIRSIGAVAQDEQFATQDLSIAYDAVVYLRDTTEARQLPKKP